MIFCFLLCFMGISRKIVSGAPDLRIVVSNDGAHISTVPITRSSYLRCTVLGPPLQPTTSHPLRAGSGNLHFHDFPNLAQGACSINSCRTDELGWSQRRPKYRHSKDFPNLARVTYSSPPLKCAAFPGGQTLNTPGYRAAE